MDNESKSDSEILVGGEKERLPRRKIRIIMAMVAGVLVVLIAAYALYYAKVLLPARQTAEQAIDKSKQAAIGFDSSTQSYVFEQMRTAIQYASDSKCSEARSIYRDVARHPNGMSDLDMKVYKEKIDTLCSKKD